MARDGANEKNLQWIGHEEVLAVEGDIVAGKVGVGEMLRKEGVEAHERNHGENGEGLDGEDDEDRFIFFWVHQTEGAFLSQGTSDEESE